MMEDATQDRGELYRWLTVLRYVSILGLIGAGLLGALGVEPFATMVTATTVFVWVFFQQSPPTPANFFGGILWMAMALWALLITIPPKDAALLPALTMPFLLENDEKTAEDD